MNTVLNFDFATFQFAFCVRIRLEFGVGDWLTGAAKCDTNLRRSVSALRRPSRYPTDAFVSITLHLTSAVTTPRIHNSLRPALRTCTSPAISRRHLNKILYRVLLLIAMSYNWRCVYVLYVQLNSTHLLTYYLQQPFQST